MQAWDTPQRFPGQVEAAHAVQHHHVEWRRRRALLVVAAHVEALRVGAAVHELVDRPLVAMEREDHRRICRKEVDKLRLAQPVWVHVTREECHQVDHVDHAHLQLWRMLA